jgi:protein ImuB
MRLAEAEALWASRGGRRPQFVQHDLQADHEGLIRLAEWCARFTPLVGLAGDDSLRLDITGCAHLFGGEAALARRVLLDFRRCGLHVRIGLADTPGAAWAVARYETSTNVRLAESRRRPRAGDERDNTRGSGGDEPRRSSVLNAERDAIRIVPSGAEEAALARLPVAALRLPPETLAMLETLSLRRIGQLLALPRSTRPARFGLEMLQRIDQALGRVPEPIVTVRPQSAVTAHYELPAPTADRGMLESVLSHLISEIVQQLAPRREGVQRLDVCCKDAEGQATTFTVGTVQPTGSAQHLTDLACTQLEQVQLKGDVLSLRLTAESISPLETHQLQLLEGAQSLKQRCALWQLADRLRTRLGQDCVVQPVLCPDPQPERAVEWAGEEREAMNRGTAAERRPLNGRMTKCRMDQSAHSTFEHSGIPTFSHARPLELLPEPEPVSVVCAQERPVRVRRGAREHLVAACCGPERIETGWWRGADSQRDYYRVETAEGMRLWVFRRLREEDWFVHGEFE